MLFFRIVSQALLTGLIFANLGCSSSVTKPEGPSTVGNSSAEVPTLDPRANAEGTGATDDATLRNSDQKDSNPRDASSLDQMRAGKSTASSPTTPLKDILFEFDRYDLTSDAREILKANADWLKRYASAQVEVEGHTDERGASEYNLALGAKRSQIVRDYLVALGIGAERITTISYGEEIPACLEANENCWSHNRRARFVVIPSTSAFLQK